MAKFNRVRSILHVRYLALPVLVAVTAAVFCASADAQAKNLTSLSSSAMTSDKRTSAATRMGLVGYIDAQHRPHRRRRDDLHGLLCGE